MKVLALTALVQEGPMARAYLALLYSQGYRLNRIVLMVRRRDAATGKQIAPWLPAALRCTWARTIQDLRMNHWPRALLRQHGQWCRPWLQRLAQVYGFAPSAFDALTERPDYRLYSDHVDEVLVDGLNDTQLARRLQQLPARTAVLFTGGGMVPAALLSLPNLRFIHVHPGLLPQVRGADGMLWSVLLRGRPGVSAFYMNAGLDTGDIILAIELQLPPLPDSFTQLDPASAYRMLYAFVDPMLRAVHFARMVAQAGPDADLFALPARRQAPDDGVTFHFMSEPIRQFTYARWQSTGFSLPAGASPDQLG